MTRFAKGSATLLLALILPVAPLFAQVDKKALFEPAVKAIAEAKADQAELLAPRLLEEAEKKLKRAEKAYQENRKISDVQKRVKEAAEAARHAREVALMGKVAFKTLLPAREAAAKARAAELAPELYKDAEKLFNDAVKALQYGDLEEAKARGERAEAKYREAELVAIKAALLGKARGLRRDALEAKADKLAPVTFGKAESYLAEAENLLDKDRYAAERASELASRAEYEYRHAIYLAGQIREAAKEPALIERGFLNYETNLARIGAELSVPLAFDQDVEEPTRRIIEAIRTIQQEDEKLQKSLAEREQTIADLRRQIKDCERQHASLEEQLRERNRELEARRIREAKIKKIKELFSPDEAEVLMVGDNLVIRLVGLSFPVGKAVIAPKYFELLAKLQQAIREFPDAHITVEGHTDSQGDEKTNQRLSFERANAVRQYLLANMGLPEDRVSAIGYGESRPIASNETKEGRAKNRRIDVVLTMP
ncbi:MAG: OmpA family protein [Calditrichaeota bacterium]|nr:OmpA family protein [Calditrichota bacterium]